MVVEPSPQPVTTPQQIPKQETTARRPSKQKPKTVKADERPSISNHVFTFIELRTLYLERSVSELIDGGKMTKSDDPDNFKSLVLDKTIENMSADSSKISDEIANGDIEDNAILNENIHTFNDVKEAIETKQKEVNERPTSVPVTRQEVDLSTTKDKPTSTRHKTSKIKVDKPPPQEKPLEITTTEHKHKPLLRSNSTDRLYATVHSNRDVKPKSNENVSPYIKELPDKQLKAQIENKGKEKQTAMYRKQLLIEQNFRLTGNGLRRRVGRPKGSGILKPFKDRLDTNLGIQPMANYISFGKYAINTKKLNDDIISIRHKSGGNIIGHPSRKVSPNMAKVFRKIVGNGLPDFEDLSNLTQEERQYLYDVSKKADIVSKLNIPAPSRDQQDKDNHNFEVMKGEILSGNDSVEMVKKFKVLILKMSKSGGLPKAQVAELLTDLAELGY